MTIPAERTSPAAAGAPRTAIVHDWLTGMRGGEKCLEALCGLVPGAEIFTLVHARGSVAPGIERLPIRTSFLQRLPGVRGGGYRSLLPLFPAAVAGLDVGRFPRVLSVSHCAAKGVRVAPGARHVCYCLTPMRYVWDMFPEYFGRHAARRLSGLPARALAAWLRRWDVATSRGVDAFVAISRFVAARIRRCYGREAAVVYPPVAWSRYRVEPCPDRGYYLAVTAPAPYKRLDVVLDAARRTGRRIVVVGRPPPLPARVRADLARANVQLSGWVSDGELRDLYANCRALLYPGCEDFGLVPVEAQASGRPVIAWGRGGVLESVRGVTVEAVRRLGPDAAVGPGAGGVFFQEATGRALAEAIACFETLEERFDPHALRERARRFDVTVFERAWRERLGRSGRWGEAFADGQGDDYTRPTNRTRNPEE